MNRKLLEIRDNLKGTLDAMTYVKTNEELDRLFVSVCAELISYDIELREEIKER